MRILVVEDEVDLAAALQRALRDEGYACDVAHDGPAGRRELASADYDLVVLDLMLPGVPGRELLAELRRAKPTPVLVLTARDAVGDKIALTPMEFALVEYLALHRGELVTRTALYEHLYDASEDTASNVIDVYVSNVRRKLGRDFVRTRRGEGYIVDE